MSHIFSSFRFHLRFTTLLWFNHIVSTLLPYSFNMKLTHYKGTIGTAKTMKNLKPYKVKLMA